MLFLDVLCHKNNILFLDQSLLLQMQQTCYSRSCKGRRPLSSSSPLSPGAEPRLDEVPEVPVAARDGPRRPPPPPAAVVEGVDLLALALVVQAEPLCN